MAVSGFDKRPAVGVMTASADAKTGVMTISGFQWYGATTAAHSCVVKDTAGNVVWSASVAAAGDAPNAFWNFEREVDGLVVTMGSGTLLVYLE